MTDNNYKLTLIFYKSNKAPYINVTAISLDKKKTQNRSRKGSGSHITVNVRDKIKHLLRGNTPVFVKYCSTKKGSAAQGTALISENTVWVTFGHEQINILNPDASEFHELYHSETKLSWIFKKQGESIAFLLAFCCCLKEAVRLLKGLNQNLTECREAALRRREGKKTESET